MKKILLIGSTGSIGQATIEVVKHLPQELKLVAICARSYSETLLNQIKELEPVYTIVTDPTGQKRLQAEGLDIRDSGMLLELVRSDRIDTIVFAKSGIELVEVIFEAIKQKKRICLATKEIIVGFGELINRELDRHQAELLPIDSEHVALHQCLDRRRLSDIKRVILTASGGPFFGRRDLSQVTPKEALKHPVWSMGKKITIDSATLFNKGLEMIEAHFLYRLPPEKIEVIIHPQSIVHSLVEFTDNSILAQLSNPDMRLPIQYALLYPERVRSLVEPIDLARIKTLTFHQPDYESFPALNLARKAIVEGGTMPAVLVSADETAVDFFIRGKITFVQIAEVIRKTLAIHKKIEDPDLDDIRSAMDWAKGFVREECSSLS
ncbi:MAG TPA: 1-deoxy-D-xylulose-5-phosphate reductoisomerase [bacterium (Candidatus Stahlbacteria)]|nr:1-deoxy-D-xylulose-5-phosphate reductoisomerase [Candidatus Stahlbacteria bacterium]